MRRRLPILAGLLLAAAGLAHGADPELPRIVGYVDGAPFARLAEDDATKVEISLQGALLRALTKVDPEMSKLVSGLESIHAVILDLSDTEGKAPIERWAAMIGATESALTKKGWQRIARVREGHGADVQVLTLSDGDVIKGLVVMVIDPAERQMVFANVAGIIDLAALERIGAQFEIPGLDAIAAPEGGKKP